MIKKIIIDIGNSKTAIALAANGILSNKAVFINSEIMDSEVKSLPLKEYLQSICRGSETENTVVASVNAKVCEYISEILAGISTKPIKYVNYQNCGDLIIGINNPNSLGADRIANALALSKLHNLPGLVIDIGTATTIDYVDSNKQFLGGVILPGLEAWASVLNSSTAQLPKVNAEWTESVLGKDTKSAISVGLTLGYLDLLEGLCKRFQSEFPSTNLSIICTGGGGKLFCEKSKMLKLYDPDLTLKGLSYI